MTFVELLQKALNDREFKKRLVIDPEGALQDVGMAATAEQVRSLKDATLALVAAQCAFDDVVIDNI